MITLRTARRAAAIGATAGIMFAGAFIPASAADLGQAGNSSSGAATTDSTTPAASASDGASTDPSSQPSDTSGAASGSPSDAASGAAPRKAATASAAKPKTDDNVKLMSEMDDYWKAAVYDDSTDETKEATAFRGDVTKAGAKVLKSNDETYTKINHAAAKDDTQAHRGLVDADYDWKETLPDSLGPVLGKYFSEGITDGSLAKSSAAFDDVLENSSTGKAKPYFNFPRPFLEDRSFKDTETPNNLRGLDPNLKTAKLPDWTDDNGKKHTAEYDELAEDYSQAFPSGHTTFAYEETLLLAELLPELGPEIATRGSEAGNNRVAIGVHYPLDVMGGRILGHAHTASTLSDSYVKDTLLPARKQLVNYLTDKCKDDGHGSSLAACITATKANGTGGYTNDFTDAVATVPVKDRDSALKVYKERMTYGFDKVSGTSGDAKAAGSKAAADGDAPKVPKQAAALLTTAFPSLDEKQRKAVLAATETEAGYPLDSSSDGWARIDLPAAMSAKVTVDGDGTVTKVEPGQDAASVAQEDPEPSSSATDTATAEPTQTAGDPGGSDGDDGDDSGSGSGDGSGSGSDSGSGDGDDALPTTGADFGLPAGIGAALIVGGTVVYLSARKRRASRTTTDI